MLASSSQAITVFGHFPFQDCSHLVMTSAHSLGYGFHCSVILPDAAKGYYSGGKVSFKKSNSEGVNMKVRVSDHSLFCEFCFARLPGFIA